MQETFCGGLLSLWSADERGAGKPVPTGIQPKRRHEKTPGSQIGKQGANKKWAMRDHNTPANTGVKGGSPESGTPGGTLSADSTPKTAGDDLQSLLAKLANLTPEQRARIIAEVQDGVEL